MWRPVNIYIPEIIHSTTFLVLPVYSVVAFYRVSWPWLWWLLFNQTTDGAIQSCAPLLQICSKKN